MLFLHKLLPILVLPLGVTLIALLAGLAFHKVKKRGGVSHTPLSSSSPL